MPFLKAAKSREPLWKCNDDKAQKKGFLNTVYSVNGDEYTGEWLDNKKHGKGTYKWKTNGALYDGDWKHDMRNGFGTFSVPTPDGGFIKEYSGGWKDNKKHGYGTHFGIDNSSYEGEWHNGKRCGWGRMTLPDCSVYEGEWYDNKQYGQGILRLANGNRYEGSWKDGLKNGPGKFFYLDKGQVYEGVWLNDVARCGEMKDFDRETAPDPTPYPIPPNGLEDSEKVLEDAVAAFVATED